MTRHARFRPGDVVEVRLPAELLATLDDDATNDSLPFMPEMLEHVGRRFRVSHRVEKICATAGGTTPGRRMRSTVFLDDLRCDGSAHGGCQAGCRLYWKEDWLRRVDDDSKRDLVDDSSPELDSASRAATRAVRELAGQQVETYRCQATEALAASEPMNPYDMRQYIREVTSGNVGLTRLVRVLARAVWLRTLRTLRLRGRLHLPKGVRAETPVALSLQPGDQVQVRSPREIAATLNELGMNRGLAFDAEMTPYCGGTYRVHDRVDRFIDDKTGQMIELSSDCLILRGVVCSGEHSIWGRWFCPRAIYPFWREAWLRRVDEHADLPNR